MEPKVSKEQPVHIDIEHLPAFGTHASERINVHVFGYWGEMINIFLNRDWHAPTEGALPEERCWHVRISHASGGRDKSALPSDIEAAESFGRAMLEAAQFARHLEGKWRDMERVFREEQSARSAAERKCIADDAPLGLSKALRIVHAMSEELMKAPVESCRSIQVFARGATNAGTYSAHRTRTQVRFKTPIGTSIPRDELIRILAEASHRSGAAAA